MLHMGTLRGAARLFLARPLALLGAGFAAIRERSHRRRSGPPAGVAAAHQRRSRRRCSAPWRELLRHATSATNRSTLPGCWSSARSCCSSRSASAPRREIWRAARRRCADHRRRPGVGALPGHQPLRHHHRRRPVPRPEARCRGALRVPDGHPVIAGAGSGSCASSSALAPAASTPLPRRGRHRRGHLRLPRDPLPAALPAGHNTGIFIVYRIGAAVVVALLLRCADRRRPATIGGTMEVMKQLRQQQIRDLIDAHRSARSTSWPPRFASAASARPRPPSAATSPSWAWSRSAARASAPTRLPPRVDRPRRAARSGWPAPARPAGRDQAGRA